MQINLVIELMEIVEHVWLKLMEKAVLAASCIRKPTEDMKVLTISDKAKKIKRVSISNYFYRSTRERNSS